MRSTNESLLPDQDWNQLQEIADRFAEARKQGTVDDWDSLLPPESERLHLPTLEEFVKIDMEMAWRSGMKPTIDSYVPKYPELEPVSVGLVVEEYRVRVANGDDPNPNEYLARFPVQFTEFVEKIKKLPPPPSAPIAETQHKKATGTLPKDATPSGPGTPSAPAAPPPTRTTIGSICPEGYRLIERLGRGNFGEVWKAEGPGGIELALKIISQPLDDEGAKRELHSLDLVKKLQHPALAGVVAFWIKNNRLVIGMELADKTLRDRLKECRQQNLPGIPAEELLTYFRDSAVGLDYLHSERVIHRDIKPENILLKKGYAKVADFGLAKAHLGTLATGSFAGTPAFMAPEIWGGKVSKASDQYSLAFTYAELRLGRRPLKGEGFAEVMEATLTGQPDLGDIPKQEADVLRRGLAKRPEERYPSCLEFVKALERAVGVQSLDRQPFGSTPSPAQTPATGSEPVRPTSAGAPAVASGTGSIGTPLPQDKPLSASKTPVAEPRPTPPPLKKSWNAPPPEPPPPTPTPLKQSWNAPSAPAPTPPKKSWASSGQQAPKSWGAQGQRRPPGNGKGLVIGIIVLLRV